MGARAFPGNPYDGHTLHEQVEQATILMQDTKVVPNTVYVDLGYRGVDQYNPDVQIIHRGKSKRLGQKWMSNSLCARPLRTGIRKILRPFCSSYIFLDIAIRRACSSDSVAKIRHPYVS